MNKIIKKRFSLVGLIILIVLLILLLHAKITPKEVSVNSKDLQLINNSANDLSAWVTYWDLNLDNELKSLNKDLKNICYFSANFDSNSNLVVPDKLIGYYNKTKSNNYTKYITIVNDKEISSGQYSQKDVQLLRNLLSSSESRSSHIEKIIDLAVKYGFDGIEVDYENIKKDMDLWNNYITFINELYQKSGDKGLKIRVVLEPDIPFDKLNFLEGPTYVMMCYNLHGPFNGAGGKATPEFIRGLIKNMSRIPGNKDFAVATGGFSWESNGKVNAVTEIEAVKLLKEYGAEVKRDGESQCLFFSYKDENNINHEVWFADEITLKTWINVIKEEGYDVSIWRLGGNYFWNKVGSNSKL